MPQARGIPEALLEPKGDILKGEVFRYFLVREISLAVRYRHFFSVCLVAANATPGDMSGLGQEFARIVSRALSEKLRSTDAIGCLPEGFGILLVQVEGQPAVAIAERLRAHVREVAMPVPGAAEQMTISVGGACFPRDGQTEAALLTHASQCLDVAQRRGGNRVVYDPTTP